MLRDFGDSRNTEMTIHGCPKGLWSRPFSHTVVPRTNGTRSLKLCNIYLSSGHQCILVFTLLRKSVHIADRSGWRQLIKWVLSVMAATVQLGLTEAVPLHFTLSTTREGGFYIYYIHVKDGKRHRATTQPTQSSAGDMWHCRPSRPGDQAPPLMLNLREPRVISLWVWA